MHDEDLLEHTAGVDKYMSLVFNDSVWLIRSLYLDMPLLAFFVPSCIDNFGVQTHILHEPIVLGNGFEVVQDLRGTRIANINRHNSVIVSTSFKFIALLTTKPSGPMAPMKIGN